MATASISIMKSGPVIAADCSGRPRRVEHWRWVSPRAETGHREIDDGLAQCDAQLASVNRRTRRPLSF